MIFNLREGAVATFMMHICQCSLEGLSRHCLQSKVYAPSSCNICRWSTCNSDLGFRTLLQCQLLCRRVAAEKQVGTVASSTVMAKVVLYSTSCASTLKMKTDISRVKQLLQIKKVDYEEVCGLSAGKRLLQPT